MNGGASSTGLGVFKGKVHNQEPYVFQSVSTVKRLFGDTTVLKFHTM